MLTHMKTTVWILGDQLLESHPALDAATGDELCVLLIENRARVQRQPYHRKKITLVFSAMRHYADLLRARGLTVDYRITDSTNDALRQHINEHHPQRLLTMAASEYRGRLFQQTRLTQVVGVPVDVLPNTQFLVGTFDPFPNAPRDKPTVMEHFYRAMRKHFNVLMDGKNPIGGAWNFDKDNRKPLPKRGLPIPDTRHYPPDAITQAVMHDVESMDGLIGHTRGFAYAVTHAQARDALAQFVDERLALFGTYEDAMTAQHRTVFHSVLSPYVNIGLLTPLEMVDAALNAYEQGRAPLNSVEGFVRQVIGWREYMYWQYWRQMPDLLTQNDWHAQRDVPPFLWTGDTEMNCLRHVVQGLTDSAYSHHIERLMLLSNFFMLSGVEPQAAVRWFSAFYIDAYDWVMQPNVVGMGLNADGGKTATKPYIASANYIDKMSDYCGACRYNHKARSGADACPFNTLYWFFLLTHEAKLRANPRFGQAVLGLRYLDDTERAAVRADAQRLLEELWQ